MASRRTGPDTVQWEVVHQLAVTGQPAADIVVYRTLLAGGPSVAARVALFGLAAPVFVAGMTIFWRHNPMNT